LAYAALGLSYAMDFMRRVNPKESIKKAFEYTQKARSLDDSLHVTYVAFEFIYGILRQHEKAIASAEKAISLAPGSAVAHFCLGRALTFACRNEEALIHLEKAIRLNPYPPGHFFHMVGAAHFNLGNHEETVSALKKALSINPIDEFARHVLIPAYVEMGRMEEARAVFKEYRKGIPRNASAEGYRDVSPWKDPKVTERYVEALRPLFSEDLPQQ